MRRDQWVVISSVMGAGKLSARLITGRRQAASASSTAVTPANRKALRRPMCSPSQPPMSAPGPAGNRISQRMVLVMRPSMGAGVTAWRSARKLMNMNTAPTPNENSIHT